MPMGGNSTGAACGDVKFWPTASAPPGWLKANGAAVSRTTYAALFLVIGISYGAGDGATTFNIPDLRGEFLRGLDDGRGVDSARTIGSAQGGSFGSHSHGNGFSAQVLAVNGAGSYYTGSVSANTAASGGIETRPRNVALLACIKY